MYPNDLFEIFGLGIDLYTICFTLGIVLAFVWLIIAMKREGYNSSARDVIVFCGIFGVGAGVFSASLFQSFYDFIANPEQGFSLTGRMTFIGGILGGTIGYLITYFIFTKLINPRLKEGNIFKADMNKGLFEMLKFLAIAITIAHFVGRIGCFFAGCCYGIETNEWYGIQFPGHDHKVIPTQLFEAIFLFVLSVVLFVLYFKFNFKYGLGLYGISYGIWRFLIEFIRDDDRGSFIFNLSPSQFWSIVFVIFGIAFIPIYKYFYPKVVQKD